MTGQAIDTEALRRFEIRNEGQYGGGAELEHRFGDCDWHPCVDGMNPLEVLALAHEHAATCDGSRVVPAPRPPMSPEAAATSAVIAATWGNALEETLRWGPLFSARGGDARGA